MYFLNGVYFTRQSCVKAWPTLCHNVLKLTCAPSGKTPSNQYDPCRTSPVGGVHHYKDTLRHALGPSMWTQVRFRNGHPRFHNDIEFPNFDAYRKDNYIDVRKTKWGSGDEKPGYTYLIGFLGMMGAAYSVKGHGSHYIMSMAAAADVRAMAAIEIDLTKIAPGATSSFKWRGKPLFIKNRTQADIDFEYNTPLAVLRDPESPEKRCTKPEWLIVIGICTHLGCVPVPNSGDWAGGFYCPCHGSHYDNLGRARKGPAPLNLEVPPYVFVTDTLLLVG